jgi:cyclopropane-fatty-acyl-phospholipid synthase
MKPAFIAPVDRKYATKSLQTPVLAGFARKLLFKHLEKLSQGQLLIIEGDDVFRFGETDTSELVAELRVHDPSCYIDILLGGSIGAAESYMTADWSSSNLTNVIRVLAKNLSVMDEMEGGIAALSKPFLKFAHLLRQNTEKGSRRNIAAHYDLGNEFFKLFLDDTMMYSSGIFPHKKASMAEASTTKLKRICDKLQLNADDRVVEIGTGWGGFAIYAAKHYGCHVTTTTISEQQYLLAKQRVEEEGLADKITLLTEDYRDLPKLTEQSGRFDKLVSIEMIEAVGWKFYDTFFQVCSDLLKPEGVMLIQAITIEDQRFERAKRDVDFIKKYIFPGSCIPSIQALLSANAKSSDMRIVHQDDFAEHYARTLKSWSESVQNRSQEVFEQGYSEDFLRMWAFYLSYCEGGFLERTIGVSHLVFAKPAYRNERI